MANLCVKSTFFKAVVIGFVKGKKAAGSRKGIKAIGIIVLSTDLVAGVIELTLAANSDTACLVRANACADKMTGRTFTTASKDLDHPTDSIGAIETGFRAANNFDTLNMRQG